MPATSSGSTDIASKPSKSAIEPTIPPIPTPGDDSSYRIASVPRLSKSEASVGSASQSRSRSVRVIGSSITLMPPVLNVRVFPWISRLRP
jgi:hypothetical protein